MPKKIVYFNRGAELLHRHDLLRCSCGSASFTASLFTPGSKARVTIGSDGEPNLDEAEETAFDSHCYISGYTCERCRKGYMISEGRLERISGPMALGAFIEQVAELRYGASELIAELELAAARTPIARKLCAARDEVLRSIGILAANGWWDEGLEFLRGRLTKKGTADGRPLHEN